MAPPQDDPAHRVIQAAASCKLQAASCKLQAASCKLQAASCKLQAASCKLQAASCKLQAVSCKLQAASCKLQAASCKLLSMGAGWRRVASLVIVMLVPTAPTKACRPKLFPIQPGARHGQRVRLRWLEAPGHEPGRQVGAGS